MKKLLYSTLAFLLLMSFEQANSQSFQFHFYPDQNVYYDVSNSQYIYLSNGNWVKVRTLPSTIKIVKTAPRYTLFNSTPQIWVYNAKHVKKYPRGKAYGYYKNGPGRPAKIVVKKGNNGRGKH